MRIRGGELGYRSFILSWEQRRTPLKATSRKPIIGWPRGCTRTSTPAASRPRSGSRKVMAAYDLLGDVGRAAMLLVTFHGGQNLVNNVYAYNDSGGDPLEKKVL